MKHDTDERPWLLPDTFRKASFILWVMLLPQALLLLLNVRAWDLVHGEMSTAQRGMALTIGGAEAVLLALGLAAWALLRRRRADIGWRLCAGMLAAHLGYLWMVTAWLEKLLPESVAIWMLPASQVLYYQYALMMPAAFYAGLRLSCFKLPLHRGADIGIAVATLVGVPVGWFLLLQLSLLAFRWATPPFVIMMIFLVGSTVIVLLAFLRLLLFLYAWLNRLRAGWFIVPLLAGIVAPVAGLVLNWTIPFPYDFQDPMIYALALLNGLLLLAPSRSDPVTETLGWVLRSAMYAFTLYFFIVFLPFLPLSLLAMIACGAGCLILAPTLLFVVHTRRLLDEGRRLAGRFGALRTVLLFGLCVSVIPAGYTVRALVDRGALTQAINAVYSPDYTRGDIELNRGAAKRALHRLRSMKDGIYVPFLTDYYNRLVFGGMVLPDHKMDAIGLALFGAKPVARAGRAGFGDIFSRSRGRNRWAPGRVRTAERNVELVDTRVEEKVDGDLAHASLVLELRNRGSAASEFVADIVVPDGVLVTGYWLDVAGERVPGRIFERKAAMWVYHMIRDTTRRDPGLLVYSTPNRLRLSVYPFAANECRVTGIDLAFPDGLQPALQVADRPVVLGRSAGPESDAVFRAAAGGDGRQWLVVPGAAARALPAVARQPYLHFIVDSSEQARRAFPRVLKRVETEAARAEGIDLCRVTLANSEFRDVTDGLVPLSGVKAALDGSAGRLPFRGGLWAERAIKSALLEVLADPPFNADGEPLAPLFVVVRDDKTEPVVVGDDLAAFRSIVPEVDAYYVTREDGRLDAHPFDGGAARAVDRVGAPAPVVLLRMGEGIAACGLDGGAVSLAAAPSVPAEVYDPGRGGFQPVPAVTELLGESVYSDGLDLLDACRATVFDPARLRDGLPAILRRSRETGVLAPLTSYIVVENTAQWKMLQRKESQALGANRALEFDEFVERVSLSESPEPSILYLLPVVFLLPWWRRKQCRA